MENSHYTETQCHITTAYPETISKTTSHFTPQVLLWTLIAVVLFVIYLQQPERNNTLGYIQISLVIVCAILAFVKFCTGDKKLTYTPTGSPIAHTEKYYNISLEDDIRLCLREGNTSRLNAFRTDETGGILIETLESKDKTFTAARMQKYYPEGYRPATEWFVFRNDK